MCLRVSSMACMRFTLDSSLYLRVWTVIQGGSTYMPAGELHSLGPVDVRQQSLYHTGFEGMDCDTGWYVPICLQVSSMACMWFTLDSSLYLRVWSEGMDCDTG